MKRYKEYPDSPFVPSFGKMPNEVIGRQEIIEKLSFAVDHPNDTWNKTLITGVRGSGKTTILTNFENLAAEENDLMVFSTSAMNGNNSVLNQVLDQVNQIYEQANTELSMKHVEFSLAGIVKMSLDKKESRERSFITVMEEFMDDFGMKLGENKDPNKLIITVDEAQADFDGLRELGSAFQLWERHDYNVMIIVAGLPVLTLQVGEDKALSFLARGEQYAADGLALKAVADMYLYTFKKSGFTISTEIAEVLAERSKGYPFMVQLLGSEVWQQGAGVIDCVKIDVALENSRQILNRRVFDLIARDMSDFDKVVLTGIVKLSDQFSPKELQDNLQKDKGQINKYIRRLENFGVVSRQGRGTYSIVLPFFKEYVINEMD